MKKISLLLLLALAGATQAQAQGGMRSGMRGGGMPPLDDASFRPTVAQLTTMLTLTSEQAAKITPLRDSLLLQTRAHREEATRARTDMIAARRAGVGPDSMLVLRDRMQTTMMAMLPARLAFHDKVRALLTPEQARIMDARQQEMLGTMGQRMNGAGPGRP